MMPRNSLTLVWTTLLVVGKLSLEADAFVLPSSSRLCGNNLSSSLRMAVTIDDDTKTVVNEKSNDNESSYTPKAVTNSRPEPRILKKVNPLRLSPLESEYLASVALHIGKFQTGNSIAFTMVPKLNPAPFATRLQQAARSSRAVPQIMSLATDRRPLFGTNNPRETVVAEGVETISQDPVTGEFSVKRDMLNEAIFERIAYLLLEDLNNIRDGIYPFPSGMRLAKQVDPTVSVPEFVQQVYSGLNFATKDTYSGNVEYEAGPNQPSKYLLKLAQDIDNLPDYYLNDFHSVPGGFLNPEHPPNYDLVSETVFWGTHLMSRRMMLRPIAEAMKLKSGNGQKLLDLGTGMGSFLIQVQEAFPSLALTGLDLSPAMLDYADQSFQTSPVMQQATAPSVELIQANMEKIPKPDESFDFVTQSNCFHEMPEFAIRNTAAEIARVLKPGGLFVHHDAVQMRDDPSMAKPSRVTFDRRFNEPYILNFMENVDLDDIFAEHGLYPTGPAKPYYTAAIRAYQKKME